VKSKNFLIICIAILLLAGIILIFSLQKQQNDRSNAAEIQTLRADLREMDSSGVSGQAILQKSQTGGIDIDVKITGYNKNDPYQPTFIQSGSCEDPDDLEYPLTDTVDGHTRSSLTTPFGEFIQKLPLVVTIREGGESEEEIKEIIACGELMTQTP